MSIDLTQRHTTKEIDNQYRGERVAGADRIDHRRRRRRAFVFAPLVEQQRAVRPASESCQAQVVASHQLAH